MTLNEYQDKANWTVTYPKAGENAVYPAMGVAGEAGEVCDKVKKYWRNSGLMSAHGMPPEERYELIKELGDVLWYISALARELDCPLEEVANLNLNKLYDRKNRNVVKGSGDNR